LTQAGVWLCRALKYFDTAIQQGYQPVATYSTLAGNLQAAIDRLNLLITNLPTKTEDFKTYQDNNIYAYMGDLGFLYQQMTPLLDTTSSNLGVGIPDHPAWHYTPNEWEQMTAQP